MMKYILALVFSFSSFQLSHARPVTDNITICYLMKNNSVKSKHTCIVESSGGAGVSVLTYTIKDKNYEIVEACSFTTDKCSETLNDMPFKGYGRDSFFNVDNQANNYYCYKSKNIHFCTKAIKHGDD